MGERAYSKPLIILFSIVFGGCTVGLYAFEESVETDQKDWLDPGEMFNTHYRPTSNSPAEPVQNQCERDYSLEDKLQSIDEELQNCLRTQSVFVRRLTRNIVSKLQKHESLLRNGEITTFNLDLMVTLNTLRNLESFTKNGSNIAIATSTVEDMIGDLQPMSEDESKFAFSDVVEPKIVLVILLMLLLCLELFRLLYVIRLTFRLLLTTVCFLFIISVVWTWCQLYQTALADKVREETQTLASTCDPPPFYAQFFSMFILHPDACTQLYRRRMVDPIFEITPTHALSTTLIRFFLEPAEHVGRAANKLVRSSLEGLPMTLWPVVLTIVCGGGLVLLLVACGYRVRVLHIFSLEPTAENRSLNRELEQSHKELRQLIQKQSADLTDQMNRLLSDNRLMIEGCNGGGDRGMGSNGLGVRTKGAARMDRPGEQIRLTDRETEACCGDRQIVEQKQKGRAVEEVGSNH